MMARKLTSREYFLVGFLAVMGVAYVLYRDEGRLFGGAGEEEKGKAAVGIAPIVRMHRLAGDAEAYDPKGRNLFEYYTPPRKQRTQPVTKPAAKKPAAVRPNRPRKEMARQKPEPVLQPPRIDFKYLGFLGPKDDKIAVFEDGEEMLLARAGETVEGSFLVVEFKYESVVMGYTDTRFKDMTTELEMRRN